jgi:hypothetical protein
MKTYSASIFSMICGAMTLCVAQTKPISSLPTLAKQFADANEGKFRKATEEELQALEKL